MSNKAPENTWGIERLGKITSSRYDVLTVGKPDSLSVGALTYIDELECELRTGTSRDIDSIYAIQWGNRYEPEAAALLEKEYEGFEYYGKQSPKFFPLTDHSGGSPDAAVKFPGKIVFEIKAPENPVNHLRFLRCKNGDDLKALERKYWSQTQMNMACVAKAIGCMVIEMKGIFVSYNPLFIEESERLKQITVSPCPTFHGELLKRIGIAEKKLIENIRTL